MLTDTSAIQDQYSDPTLEHIATMLRYRPGDRAAWDDAVEAAAEALQVMGNAHWFVGDLACLIASENGYGTNAITNFAKDINESEGKVREWRTVSKFWTPQRRAPYIDQEFLRYSHFRIAVSLKDDAEAFLTTCLDEGWNVDRARVERRKAQGERVAPLRLLKASGTIRAINPDGGLLYLVVELDKGVNWYPLQDAQNERQPVEITIRELEARVTNAVETQNLNGATHVTNGR